MWEYNYDCEMLHAGVKGMKWGHRLYQNKDGSLTALGRLRYGKGSGKRKAAAAKAKTKAETKKDIEKKKQEVLKSRSAKELYKNADLFSTQELQTAYKRLQLERDILNLSPKEVSKGEQFVSKAIKAGKTINDVADTSIKIYNNAARVYNAFSDGKKASYIPNADGGKKKKDKKKDDDD